MTVTLYVNQEDVAKVNSFLGMGLNREHDIFYYTDVTFLSFPTVQIQVTYDQYIRLEDWKIKTKD